MNFSKLMLALFFTVGATNMLYCQKPATFYSQFGQDAYVYNKFFVGKIGGVFIDIGANDGITLSNSYFFETQLGWTGICVEPLPAVFEKLRRNRSSICIEGCVYDKADTVSFLSISGGPDMLSGIVDNYHPAHLQRIEREVAETGGAYEKIQVRCYAFNDLLASNNIYHVDYLTIDTEGGELEILKSIDFSRFDISVIDVENNYNDPEFERYMATQGYRKLTDAPHVCDEFYTKLSE